MKKIRGLRSSGRAGTAAARAAPELVEPVLGKMKRVGENFSYPFYAIKAAMLNLLVFL